MEDLWRQVAELQVKVILLRTNTTTLANLDCHTTRDDITRGKILGSRGVTLHETFTLRVQEVTSLSARTCKRVRPDYTICAYTQLYLR